MTRSGATRCCILVAAGTGQRLGQGQPKALVMLGGRSLLEHAVAGLALADLPGAGGPVPAVTDLVVVAPPDLLELTRSLSCAAWAAAGRTGSPVVVVGGSDRQASVQAGLAATDVAGDDIVLVHDAARALTPTGLVGAVLQALQAGHLAVVPGLPASDTIKRVRLWPAGGATGPGTVREVVGTLDRADLVQVQTPQGFRADVLRAAHAAARTGDGPATDDAGLVERSGAPVVVVPGDAEAFKITTAFDLAVGEALLLARG